MNETVMSVILYLIAIIGAHTTRLPGIWGWIIPFVPAFAFMSLLQYWFQVKV